MIMSGNLQFINSQMLFQYLENNRKTVTFRVRHGEWNRNFYFEEGKIVWVSSESPDELLGDWLVRAGQITGAQMRQFLQDSLAAGEQFTSYLMDVGCLSQENLEDAVSQLARFVEPVYLHQAVARLQGGELVRFDDLPQALAARLTGVESWRVHFHMPIFIESLPQCATTQAFLPLLRPSHGRIVNISSVSGGQSSPFLGAYCASKHAVEAVAERAEVPAAGVVGGVGRDVGQVAGFFHRTEMEGAG